MIKKGEDVAVVERGEELVLEGDETEESPCDSNKATWNLALKINTPKKDRDSSNTGRVPVSGYSLCRCEGTLSDLMAGKADCLKQLNEEDDLTP